MAEWSKAAVLKTVIPSDRDRGFESHSLLQSSLVRRYLSFSPINKTSLYLSRNLIFGKSMFTIFFTFVLFTGGIMANKLLLCILPPTLFVGIRMLTAGFILFLYSWHRHKATLKNIQRDWLALTGVAVFTTFLPSILKAYALSHLPAAQATLLGSIDPFVTAFYLYMLWGEKLTISKMVGILLGFIGVVLSINLTLLETTCVNALLPQLAALGAVILSRFGWIMVQMKLRKNLYTPAQLNSIIMMESGLLALTASPWLDPARPIVIPSLWKFTGLMSFTVIFGNVIAYTLYGQLLKHHNATLISLAGFSIPVFTGILSWIFLGEKITINFLVSATIIFVGLIIFYRDELKHQKLKELTS